MIHTTTLLVHNLLKNRFLLDWSRNKSDERKIVETMEINRFYNQMLDILATHFDE